MRSKLFWKIRGLPFWQIVLKLLWCCQLHPNFCKESCWWNTVVWVPCNMFKEEISIPLRSIHKSNMNWVISCEEIIFFWRNEWKDSMIVCHWSAMHYCYSSLSQSSGSRFGSRDPSQSLLQTATIFSNLFFFLTGSHEAEKRSGNYVLLGTVPFKTKFSS